MTTPRGGVRGLLVRIVPKHRRVIAEFDTASLVERTFSLLPAGVNAGEAARVRYDRLLPEVAQGTRVTTAQAAELVGVTSSTIRRWAREHRVVAEKERGNWMIVSSSLPDRA